MSHKLNLLPKETRILLLDTSNIEDFADFGGLLYQLKQVGILDGRDYQIDNDNDLLMEYNVFTKCQTILEKHAVNVINP